VQLVTVAFLAPLTLLVVLIVLVVHRRSVG
jgi:hypothetical protein